MISLAKDVSIRRSAGAAAMGLGVIGFRSRPDFNGIVGDVAYVVRDIFTTHSGNWDVGKKPPPWGIEQWAREAYLKPWGAPDYFDDAGADHHLFASAKDGNYLLRDFPFVFWSDGLGRLGDAGYGAYTRRRTKLNSGWTNIPMSRSSGFDPANNVGPWCYTVDPDNTRMADVIVNVGLPGWQHVSTFAVWQRIKLDTSEPVEPPVVTPPGPGGPLTREEGLFLVEMAMRNLPSMEEMRRLDELRKRLADG